jgi:HK97 family phage prohead protease
MDKEKLEYREAQIENYDAESGIVEGYAVVFDKYSTNISDFSEIISRDAISQKTIKDSDIFAVIDHDRSKGILARSKNGKGSLTLSIDEKGLKYSFQLPNSAIGQELRSYLERGEITTSSFAFTVSKESWAKTNDNKYIRTIEQIDRIYDVSPVFNAAYADTKVALRSLDELKQSEIDALNEAARISEAKAVEERNNENERLIKLMKLKLMLM